MTKEERTNQLYKLSAKALVGTKEELANFISRLNSQTKRNELTVGKMIHAIESKVHILKATACTTGCPNLPSPSQQNTMINNCRAIVKSWRSEVEKASDKPVTKKVIIFQA